MKVIQITAFSGYGCTGRIVEAISKKVVENNGQAIIAWGRTNSVTDKKITTYRIGNNLNVIFHLIKARLFDRAGFGSKIATKKLIRFISNNNPDIIHLHIIHGYYINIKLLFEFLKKTKIQVVWTFHDCWAFTGHCPYFEIKKCDKWKKLCKDCPEKKHHPKSLFWDSSKKNYIDKYKLYANYNNLTIVTPSVWLSKLVKQSFLKDAKIKIINNGIDLSKFYKRNKTAIKSDKKIVLGVSSVWGPEKGFDDFVKLSQDLPQEYQIVMVGLSKKKLKQLPKNIIGIKRTNNIEELAEYYSAAFVFLNLTYSDNYPTTNLEAIACGTPVITYNTGGSVEIVKSTGYGKIVEQGDLKSIVDALEEIDSIRNIKYDLKELDQEIKFEEYYELYEELLKNE